MTTSTDDDAVGYGRPPTRTRWPKGKSGNPRGAPKRTETALEMVDRILMSPVTVTISGETKRVTALEAIVSQLQVKELAGITRATRVLLEYREFASQNSERKVRLIFLDDDDGAGGDQV